MKTFYFAAVRQAGPILQMPHYKKRLNGKSRILYSQKKNIAFQYIQKWFWAEIISVIPPFIPPQRQAHFKNEK